MSWTEPNITVLLTPQWTLCVPVTPVPTAERAELIKIYNIGKYIWVLLPLQLEQAAAKSQIYMDYTTLPALLSSAMSLY